MERHPRILASALLVFGLSILPSAASPGSGTFALPPAATVGKVPLESALSARRSVRSYAPVPLSIAEAGQILWAAQGVTEPKRGLRTAPSARALYLLRFYLCAGAVDGLPKGMYRYVPGDHALDVAGPPSRKDDLSRAVGQRALIDAPAALVIAGISDGSSNPRWMDLEAGHAAQNVYLQATVLGLGTVAMAGFPPDAVKKALSLPENEHPIYVMPLGRRHPAQ